ncbi:MAG: 16S rRNA (guanine(527)-N(7))-methyltransferase RsmG [Chlorobium sp.]|uniref:16S rRNA (guanine(527)-N(7))-methyltransferase RsmG n=1 Tax=Chlorobium sp. TaxID=1095 RepID=UPI001DCD40DA|nr:16S rRNA (guanine(527)-N(7))-methyltransferase RsmG [Chlorobium sp.]MBN1279987.1 16S rRNA (guanine(527)-N(7))-methyltransferase RsmG [Chlorobiaceae bacterium]MCF8216194.1 16S rRNA (guanine(527)-N(7))-methyltransferase RsmG [Chlorobium sp.]MCF8271057.1 16S rRNA (guanine(527)-N(7))-methyltransferase RsmG [Chlorobium sp.]MCF8287470.1 16S rRNA (guanine(527)-N(7))-methyltransferase RsmG [Chlorobium sp.]MCF8290970.1 16S rRNA (guanine(527)-N(7))-methyltransferase RsmG [Chlorobium sp.]
MKRQNEETDSLCELCSHANLPLTPFQYEQLTGYASLLEQWNRKINLISRKEDAPVIIKHVFHSLLMGIFHPFSAGEKVLDIGTGGGLPGIPLAIAWPDTRFLLVDSTGKKIAACQAMLKELNITNAVAVHSRVEELKGLSFDTVLSRQVAQLEQLCGYAGRFLKPGGVLICLKGGNLKDEIKTALEASHTHYGFPVSVEHYPINRFSPFFAEKEIVIARK